MPSRKHNEAGPTILDVLAWALSVERDFECSVRLYLDPRTTERGRLQGVCSVVISFPNRGVLQRWTVSRETPVEPGRSGAIEAAWIRCMISIGNELEYNPQAKFWRRPQA